MNINDKEEIKVITKEMALKRVKKLYNNHVINYPTYVLETKKIEKHWEEKKNVEVVSDNNFNVIDTSNAKANPMQITGFVPKEN